eukprot:Blabericola_migrator_1__13432@NODE_963_length_5889_cov_140_567846_g668_i0_p3_GENE_NODE_963_length_5889_cov_140_567846_g668_i0NODE_963_length_5889_cov_140_567846_g668_i0_p3_ORF_typecomplete_len108_score9_26DAD/PF02109_16/2_4e12MerC/PF03203_14/0_0031_NODE_963_length_5889_cov_140_567846_g668_i035983921
MQALVQQQKSSPPRVLLCFAVELVMYMNCILISLYALVYGANPKQAFLSALFGSLGLAVLTMALRLQLSDGLGESIRVFKKIPEHRAFVEYTLGSVLTLLAAYTFLG